MKNKKGKEKRIIPGMDVWKECVAFLWWEWCTAESRSWSNTCSRQGLLQHFSSHPYNPKLVKITKIWMQKSHGHKPLKLLCARIVQIPNPKRKSQSSTFFAWEMREDIRWCSWRERMHWLETSLDRIGQPGQWHMWRCQYPSSNCSSSHSQHNRG